MKESEEIFVMQTSHHIKMKSILCVILSLVLLMCGLAGCGKVEPAPQSTSAAEESVTEKETESTGAEEETEPESTEAEEEPGAEEDFPDQPAAVFSVDIDCVYPPDQGAEIVQELTLKSSESISGSLTAEDVTLKDAFENMTVAGISNDAETITLTISGVPKIEGASTLPDLGTIAFEGAYFGADEAVSAYVPVICLSGEPAGDCYFYPYYDAVIDHETSKELYITLRPYNGSFQEVPSVDQLTLDGVLKDAQIVSFQRTEKEDLELVVNVTADLNIYGTESTFGTISLAAGSMIDTQGQVNQDIISYTRDYSAETQGRSLSSSDLRKIKETVNPKKSSPEILEFDDVGALFEYGNMISDYYTSGLTAYKGITSMLGAFGLYDKGPSGEEKRHQEIMAALAGISGQIQAMQEDVTAVRSYVVDLKRMLEDLSLITISDDLAKFHEHFDSMVKYTNEIATAIDTTNAEAIRNLAETYYVEGEADRQMSEEELYQVFQQFGKEICKMDQSNFNTIGTKMQDLEREYTEAMTYMKNDTSNPIALFCQKYQFLDNFSTTSLVDKELYAIDLDCQFDRALSYLKFLGGAYSQAENVQQYIDAYFPDVEAESTDEEGHPYCYLLRSNCRLLGDVANNLYKTSKSNNFTVLHTEDISKFKERMNGRSLREELALAGFNESQFMNQYTTFSDADFGSGGGCTSNDLIRGLGFSFKKQYGNYPWDPSLIYWHSRMDGIFNYMKDDKNSYAIVSEAILYNNDYNSYYGEIKTIPNCGYISKGGSYYTAGWYLIEPLTYLVRIGD